MRISISQATSLLKKGCIIGVPTETVYGLAACLDQPDAIEQLYTLKQRPRVNPLIIHLASLDDIARYAISFPPSFESLAEAFWPGPMTCILSVSTSVPSIARAGLPTAGFRIPAHPLTRALVKETGPLVMPSANLSGRPSSTRPEHIEEDFGLDFPVLDGGVCEKGLESTILLFQNNEWVIVRLGALAAESFMAVLGYAPRFLAKKEGEKPLSPGQLFRHYAPRAKLYFNKKEEAPFILGFKERRYPEEKRIIKLGSLFSPDEVAENLYQALRQLDSEGAEAAWVDMDFPREGLWLTIAERLHRAGESGQSL